MENPERMQVLAYLPTFHFLYKLKMQGPMDKACT